MKKIIVTLLSAVSALCLSLCALTGAGCGATKATFKDFSDATVEAYYGDFFSLSDYSSVYDTKGKLYSVKAVVKDSDGNVVDLLQNKFKISDVNGYTIELSILDENDGKVLKTRTLTVNTKDYNAPYITLGNSLPANAITGDTVDFELWFDSRDANFTTAVEVKKLSYDSVLQDYDEENNYKVVTVDYTTQGQKASFKVEDAGRYKVSALAWNGLSDKTQNTFVREKSFYVDVVAQPYPNAIETFDTATSKAAAYGSNRNSVNPTAKWHETFEGASGVVELKMSEYKDGKWNNQPVTLQCFNLKSSFRDASFYAEDDSWDYVSVMLYVKSEKETAKVCCSGYPDASKDFKTNEWQEFRISKKDALFFSEGGTRDHVSLSNWLSKDGGKCSWWGFLSIVAESTEDITLYVDRIAYDNEMVISTTENASVGDDVTVSAKVGTVTQGFTYTVKYPFATEETPVTDGKFKADKSGAYTITAKGTVYGFNRSESVTVNIVSANELDGFNSADSVIAAYGLNGQGNPEKSRRNATAKWHETYQGRNGVLELKPSISRTAENAGCKQAVNEYHIKSSFRDSNFYLTEDWDYISVWVYIVGNDGETVTVGNSHYMNGTQKLPCNQWAEFKVTKADAVSTAGSGRDMAALATHLSYDKPSAWAHSLIAILGEANNAKTIYLDSVSYEKNVESNG